MKAIIENRTRLNFFSGKGGVGKTILSCALAYKSQQIGLNTLLLAINPAQPIETYFGFRPIAGLNVEEVRPGLWVRNLNQLEIFDEFIKSSLKLKRIYNAVLSSHIYQYFLAAAPGIKELMTQDVIKKAIYRSKLFDRRYFDMIVVDAPATGHGLSWFSVPDSIVTTFLVGPLNKRAREIRQLFRDKEQTSIHLVTLPEEMPVNETIEYYRSLKKKLFLPVRDIILNGIFPDLSKNHDFSKNDLTKFQINIKSSLNSIPEDSKDFTSALLNSSQFYLNRRKLNERYHALLKDNISLPIYEIPLIFRKNSSMELIEHISNMF